MIGNAIVHITKYEYAFGQAIGYKARVRKTKIYCPAVEDELKKSSQLQLRRCPDANLLNGKTDDPTCAILGRKSDRNTIPKTNSRGK